MSEYAKKMLEAAKLSLGEAERGGAEYRDELLLGILQSNIAIAEALTRDECEPDPWPEECEDCVEDFECDEHCEFCRFEEETGPEYLVADREFLLDPAVRVLIRWGVAG